MLPGGIGTWELLIFGCIAVLLFGGRLPEVARNFGNSYQQFRKGLSDIQKSIQVESEPLDAGPKPSYSDRYDDYDEPSSPQFEPPTHES